MGYKAEKDKLEKKSKIIKIVLLSVLLLCVIGGCIFSFFVPITAWKYNVALPNVPKRKTGELRIHYIDVGQGDAALIEFPDEKVMLIDGGDGSKSATKSLLRYMNALEIDKIDDLVLTHADNDHSGGLLDVIKHKTIFNAYLPASFSENDTKYSKVLSVLSKEKCTISYSTRAISFSCGDAAGSGVDYSVKCLYPYVKQVEDILNGDIEISNDNEISAVIWMHYKGVGALFMGDASQEVEERLMLDNEVGALSAIGVNLQNTQLLKLAHHGSATATSLKFLQYLGVKEGIISCGKNNDYGHPAKETLLHLSQAKANVHRTDLNGHIMATISSNGEYSIKYIS